MRPPLIALVAALHSVALSAQEPAPADVPAEPYPVLVTARTREDPAVLERLQTPGRVVFRDDFEGEDPLRSYFEVNGQKEGRAVISRDAAEAHSGRASLRLTATDRAGAASGAGPVLWLGPDGHDRLHLRYYLRWARDYDQGDLNHTGGGLAGLAGSDKWRGMGTAGLRPAGDDHFSARVEGWRDWRKVPAPGYLFCYCYWMDMRRDRDGHYWGNMLGPAEAERVVPALDRWLCVELMVAVNAVGKADGELAVWLDGRLYQHWQGFRWRSSAEVRLKRASLQVYVHRARQDNTVWYDDVVVSTGYVGPQPAAPR